MPKYTFLLPAYKGRFLDEMLQSLQNQTYTDFKVIISDDCSPEDLYSICKPYLSDTRFSYRRNEENMGSNNLVSHWNLLTNMCETEYLIMASDDDVYDVSFLEELDRLQCCYPNVDLLRARVRNINTEKELIAEDAIYKEYVNKLGFIYQKHFNNAQRCIANYVFRSEALRQRGGFVDFPLAWYSDDATVMMMAEHGVVNTSKVLFNFRSSLSSISSRQLTPKDAYLKALATILFDRWFYQMMDKITTTEEKNENIKHMLKFVCYCHTHFMYEQFSYMSSFCSHWDFLKLLKMQPQKRQMRFLHNYLSARIRKIF